MLNVLVAHVRTENDLNKYVNKKGVALVKLNIVSVD